MFLVEDQQISPSERQVSGIGPGSKDEGTLDIKVPTVEPNGNPVIKPLLPFEVQHVIQNFSDMYVKLCEIKGDFKRAIDNPSVTERQKYILQKIIDDKITKINKIIISVPVLLDKMFEG